MSPKRIWHLVCAANEDDWFMFCGRFFGASVMSAILVSVIWESLTLPLGLTLGAILAAYLTLYDVSGRLSTPPSEGNEHLHREEH